MTMPWWKTDNYIGTVPIPPDLEERAGPEGVALVRLWASGKTDAGWGLNGPGSQPGFIERYTKKRFETFRVLFGYEHRRWNFAFVMRSMRVVCIDIDGKNGGFNHVGKLGMLPYTLAEVSKSGNGFHLFYEVDDVWDDKIGFGRFGDRIALEQGVDFRGTGCVFHHAEQRWNSRPIAKLPQHLEQRLVKKDQAVAAQVEAIIKILDSGDQTEVLLMHDTLISDLAKPIPPGRRNTTLFAIGNQMKQAGVPSWETSLYDRAIQVGLDSEEAKKLVSNVTKYGVAP
jgi:Bifunctional DNA primase/polymerase, N-terminal